MGDVKFADNGEWEKSRALFVQYRGVQATTSTSSSEPGKQVILYPPELRSGKFEYPYTDAQK